MLVVNAFDHIVLNVADAEASAAWYETVLGMRREAFAPAPGKAPRIAMVFGRNKINLRPADTGAEEWFTGVRSVPGSDDLCFLTDAAPDEVAAHLAGLGVGIELGPVEKQGARGKIVSVYCRDPDGNLIEISSYR